MDRQTQADSIYDASLAFCRKNCHLFRVTVAFAVIFDFLHDLTGKGIPYTGSGVVMHPDSFADIGFL